MPKNQTPSPREQAVALEYVDNEQIPRVLASGFGEAARQILAIAEAQQIPISQNQELLDLLGPTQIGQQIPPETYHLMAEVICFLYGADLEWRQAHPQLDSQISLPNAPKQKLLT